MQKREREPTLRHNLSGSSFEVRVVELTSQITLSGGVDNNYSYRSLIDCILALRVLTECSRAFRQGLLAAYVDLCKAFDSVNQDALWRILGLRGMPPKLIDLMSELYSGTESAIRCGGTISDLFPVVTGVCQGVCTGPYTFQHLCGLDSWEDAEEIKLWCIVWECQDL